MVGGEGTVIDLSLGGCRISGQGTVKPGTMLELRVQLPDHPHHLEIGLAAVRWAKNAEFGVEFLQVRKDVEADLRQIIARLEGEEGSEGSGPAQ